MEKYGRYSLKELANKIYQQNDPRVCGWPYQVKHEITLLNLKLLENKHIQEGNKNSLNILVMIKTISTK